MTAMDNLQGKGVSPGVAVGPVAFLHRNASAGEKHGVNFDSEQARFLQALHEAVCQLRTLADQYRDRHETVAQLFETHAMLAEDADFLQSVTKILRKKQCSAETAVRQSGEGFAASFEAMEDEYMRARGADFRDIAGRILRCLQGETEQRFDFSMPIVLAADDLAPSETIRLDKNRILAFVTRRGSANSHTAILARSMGIPAVCALGNGFDALQEGMTVCVDGDNGSLVLNPNADVLSAFQKRVAQQNIDETDPAGVHDAGFDNGRIKVYCNISSPAELPAVLAGGVQGVGLFRSEFLFLASEHLPSEEEQFLAYSAAAEAMGGKPVIIRTMDVGADKQAACLPQSREENPALGLRGVRLSLMQPELFKAQLRAVYRASAKGKISIMFPMIASLWEFQVCKETCKQVMDELSAQRIPFDPDVPLGVMIETPASVLIAEELAREAAFFSIGTNDLSQYILACDRQSNAIDRFFDPRHPAVLRAVKMAVDAAHQAGIWAGICGDLAADPDLLPFFLSIGVDKISVPPPSVLPMIRKIKSIMMDK